MFLAGAFAVAGLTIADPELRLGLLELGAFVTVVMVWQTARTRRAKLTYLAVVVLSASSLLASHLLMNSGQADWARALLLTSVCVKLAAVPLFFWLLTLADEVPALVLGLIIAVVDMAAFGEFWFTAQSVPGFLAPQGLLLGVAAATSFLAALLMLTQRSLKRLLVLSTVEDIGFLLLGVASLNVLGINGVVFAAANHALAKALLFVCLSGPEADGALDGEPTGLAIRYPVAAFGFLFGMLAMLGIPPTLGFIGRWRLYDTALQIHPLLLAVFIISSVFALIAYVLALTGIWWGPAREADPPPRKEPFLLQATIVALVVLLLVAGIWPAALQMLHGGTL
jgi:formate hydrogenlyase subunit 3/multisubunit Na+/H+ antiporter MnhD subunit